MVINKACRISNAHLENKKQKKTKLEASERAFEQKKQQLKLRDCLC